jgi:hypothetical protein
MFLDENGKFNSDMDERWKKLLLHKLSEMKDIDKELLLAVR